MRISSLDQPGGGNAVDFFHVYIHHDDGGLESSCVRNGLVTIACLTDDLNVGVVLENTAKRLSNNKLVIDNKHANHVVARRHDDSPSTNLEYDTAFAYLGNVLLSKRFSPIENIYTCRPTLIDEATLHILHGIMGKGSG